MRCTICGEDHAEGRWVRNSTDQTWFCTQCFESEKAVGGVSQCVVCGTWLVVNLCSHGNADAGYICEPCVSSGCRLCNHCSGVTDQTVDGCCPTCAGLLRLAPEPAYACPRTVEDRTVIHEYNFIPSEFEPHADPQDTPDLDPYLGFELEVDSPDDSRPDINALARSVTEPGISYCKHDGSLDYGFEMVSHPMTLRSHKKTSWPWKLRRMYAGGVRSAACESCALHIHVNRNFLLARQWNQLDDWVSNNQEFIVKIAQRHSTQYAKFHSDMSDDCMRSAREGSYKYAAVNFAHPETIEFRVFRGTLTPAVFYSKLEFVDALVRFFKCETDRSLENFRRVCELQPVRYAELLEFFKENSVW